MSTMKAATMSNLRLLLLAGVVSAMGGCNTTPPDAATATTFVIVRHAEKSKTDARDPPLSETGNARAQALARLLTDAPLKATYATAFQRTQQTAHPAADAHGVTVTTYDAALPAMAFASRLRANHDSGTILVVGHSNTVPEIAGALSGRPVEPMPDEEYSRIYRVTLFADGSATLLVGHY